MKLSTFFVAGTASLALAAPSANVAKRADMCGQWDNQVNGPFTTYNNLWGRDNADAGGSQCTGVDSASGNNIKWHTSWTWSGGPGQVKSYANVVTKLNKKALSGIKSLPTAWSWKYTGSNIVANVAYDLFTGKTATSAEEYEIMIWVGALGGAGPISSTGKPVATVKLAGQSWKLYNGRNGQMNVFSFVAEKNVNDFKGDLVEFISYLTSKQGLPASQILQSAGAGTEPFSGKNAKLTVSSYSLSEK